MEKFHEFTADQKIKVLYALLGDKAWKFMLWLRCRYEGIRHKDSFKWRGWEKVILWSPTVLEAKYAFVRFCLTQCEEWECEIIKLEMNKTQVGVQHSDQFTSTYYPLAVSIMGVVFSVVSMLPDEDRKALLASELWQYLLAGFGLMSILCMFYIIYMRLTNEPAAKRATYICGMIDIMQNVSKNGNALPDGNVYTVTVKKES